MEGRREREVGREWKGNVTELSPLLTGIDAPDGGQIY